MASPNSPTVETGRTRPEDAQASNGRSLIPPDTPWHRLPPEIPRALTQLCAERAKLATEAAARYSARVNAADAAFAEGTTRVESRRASDSAAAQAAHVGARSSATSAYETQTEQTRHEAKKTKNALVARASDDEEKAQKQHDSARWEAGTLFEANDKGEIERYDALVKAINADEESFAVLKAEAEARLAAYRKYGAQAAPPEAAIAAQPGDPLPALREAIARADSQLLEIESLKIPRTLMGPGVSWLFIVPWLLLVGPALYFLNVTVGLVACTVAAIVIGIALRAWLYGKARVRLSELNPPLRASLAEAETLLPRSRAWAAEDHKQRRQAIKARRDSEYRKADDTLAILKASIEEARRSGLHDLEANSAARLAQITSRRDQALREADETFQRTSDAVEAQFSEDSRRLQDEHRRHHEEATARRAKDWDALINLWESGLDRIGCAVDEVRVESESRFPAWGGPDGATWKAAPEVPPAVRFGEVRIDLASIPHGIPDDERLRANAPTSVTLPALLTFPDRGSLLIETGLEGREAAMQVLQGAMMRYLTGLPPGKVRFTIIDPVGLGRNFAGFMHLADYSELLVNSRIWTEPQQIEQRLADLSLHMETVIQQYLRGDYATLDEYNLHAGEVSEPYRVLVVADFPANFHEQSAQRLLSIATSGARCGVYTLIAVDTDQSLPNSVRLEDLEAQAATLRWENGRLAWKDRVFGQFPLLADTPPTGDAYAKMMHEVGVAAREANRVEVPFEVVAPPHERWWDGDTRAGVDIPLGRAGATKLQHLKLGRGTSQHVLIAGRTGSGKSSFLHALITNAALMYSPDQIELYLIDFKKGVEFKTYAQHELPHARVVAIESEREFGLSVLQRLDEELKRRGDIFRDKGVQDLNGYRSVPGAEPMPRILLIVDEFQEFFVEDDKTAQEVALLLDRLVRQGRAFGVHVNLGSQTLSGAYSLARSTLGQMGVRVALQCSESDAHLILSEDNAAARLLTRPGEAIYNDANGLVEGNHIFQVVWLPDDRREVYLKRIKQLARDRGQEMPRPQIVFEGNLPSDLRKNYLLRGLLSAADWPEPPKAPQAWLGEAVAIKDPTAAVFRRMGGNNLLVIGQDNEAARGLFLSSVLSLAAQHRPDAARFYLIDATPEDDPSHGLFDGVRDLLPHELRIGGHRDVGPFFDELSQELARRQEGLAGAPSVYLLLYDTSRLRDLRKSDDDFGYSFGRKGEEKKASPSQQFTELIREGPSLGMHAIAWFDTLNNVNRALDRQAMREFEMRVLFQMSANDSSNLIDSPVANRLGPNRALFSSEEQGRLEKFRPYGWPPQDWLAWVREQWRSRPATS